MTQKPTSTVTDRRRGLTDRQVLVSRERHGANVLTPVERVPWWRKLLDKFRDPLIIILLVAGALSIGISFYEYYGLHEGKNVFYEPCGIFIAIALATGLAFFFEQKAESEFAVLNRVNDDEPVKVRRNGRVRTVPRRDIVVGDIIIIATGDEIPADATLIEARALIVDESSLTGEPQCNKSADPSHHDSRDPYPKNKVLKGTKVIEGHATAQVTAVGDNSENGRLMESAQIDSGVRTPLNEQLDRLGTLISVMSYVIAALVILGRVIAYFVNTSGAAFDFNFLAYLLQSVMMAVTLIVVAVPEGLPMAVTLSLAYSMRRMLKTNNLVRRLHACETMGAATVICTDKTGTLTQNQMHVAQSQFGDISTGLDNPELQNLFYEAIACNSTAHLSEEQEGRMTVIGNPTEGALLLWLNDRGIDYAALRDRCANVAEIPFSTERKFMATLIERPGGTRVLHVKGAPERVLDMCSAIEGDIPRQSIMQTLVKLQQAGMRTLGFAYKEVAPDEKPIQGDRLDIGGLCFIAVVAIADPVRPDVPEAVQECRRAGIDVKIITGDTSHTAIEVARQIGLWTPGRDTEEANLATGADIEAMTDEELDRRVMDLKIISRSRPADKRRVVEALQRCGQVVAVTGDGTNDAPALKAAHVGLAMGDGTSVAKEAGDITIIDNSFASIGRAVMWGRSLYRNIQRFLLFQLTVNVAACLVVLAGAFMDVDAPLTVTQMLWVNLIMDTFAAMALASLPPNRRLMDDKPRNRRDFIINRDMFRRIVGVGGLFSAILIGLFFVIKHCDIRQIHSLADLMNFSLSGNHRIDNYESAIFFTTFVMLQFWNLFNAKAFGSTDLGLSFRHCQSFIFIAALIMVGQILILALGGEMFGVQPVSPGVFLLITLATMPVFLIGVAVRWLKRRRK